MTIPPAERYRRHLQLAEIGPAGQARLAAASALVVGAGGLGCAALPYLVAAGLRAVTICDGDAIEPSNLPRQVLYGDDDIGLEKADAATAKLAALNRDTTVTAVSQPLTAANVAGLVAAAAVVLDCTDDFAARYLLHDACYRAQRPLVSAAVHHDEGQLTVFRFDRDPAGPCWRCLWPQPPAAGDGGGTCREQGLLGTVPGLLGVWQADQALRVLLEASPLEPGRLVHVDVTSLRTWSTAWQAAPDCALCGGGEAVRAVRSAPAADTGPAAADLPEESAWDAIAAPTACLWIDARVDAEHARDPRPATLAGCEVVSWRAFGAAGPPPGRPCVVFCGHGIRSLDVTRHWRGRGLSQVTSLRGGLAAQRNRRT